MGYDWFSTIRKRTEIISVSKYINLQNQELFIRKNKIVFAFLKQACLKNIDFTLRIQDMDYEEGVHLWQFGI